MLTSCVLDKLVLSVPVVLFVISIDQETWNHLFVWVFWSSWQSNKSCGNRFRQCLAENGKTRTLFPAQPCEWIYTSLVLLKANLGHLGRCFFARSAKCDAETQTVFPQGKDASRHLTTSDLNLFKDLGFWQVHLKYTVQTSLRNKDLVSEPKLRVLSKWTYKEGRNPLGETNTDMAAYVRWDYKEKEKHI